MEGGSRDEYMAIDGSVAEHAERERSERLMLK